MAGTSRVVVVTGTVVEVDVVDVDELVDVVTTDDVLEDVEVVTSSASAAEQATKIIIAPAMRTLWL